MKYKVSKSKIPNADKGLFAKNKLDRGERIGLAHRDGQPVGTIGNMHNHSDNPNMRSIKVGNERYVYAIRDIEPGEELTTDYRMQPELEQPEDFMRKGGRTKGLVAMPKPSKKGLASKKYSRSLSATNRLFAVNPLFKKPKSKKNKIFDPNAKYYQDGGGKRDSPFKIKPNLYTFSQGPDSQVIGGRLDMSHKSGLHGNITAETPFMNKRIQPSSAQNIGFRKKYKNLYGDATLSNFATPGKLINPSADVELGYERDLGKGFNANIGLRNTVTPGSYYNPSLSAGIKYGFEDGGFIETELTPEEIEQYKKGGFIVEEIDDPSIPVLNAFQKGGDTKRGVQDIPEATIYSDPETKKMQLSLVQQLKAAKNAYQEFTKQNKGKKWKLTSADDAPSDIVTLKKGIQLYKDELKKEKEEISAEKAKLERLKKKLPDNKDIQNLTLKDLNSVKGKIKIEDALRKSDLDASTVAALYTGLRLDEIDYNVKRGYGSDPVYSATATEAEAMKDVPQFVNMVGNVATAIPLLGAAGAMGGVGGIGRGIANTTSALGSGIRTGFNIGSKIINNPFVRGAGKAAAMYGAGKFAMDPSGHAVGVAKTGEDLYTTGRDFVQGKEYNPKNKFGKDKWSGVDETLNVLSLPAAVSGAYRLIDLGKKIPGATTVVEGGKKVLDKLRYPFDYKLTGLLPSKIQPNPKSNVGRITDLLTTRNMFKAATGVLGANMVMEGKDQINNAQNEQQYNEGIRKVFQGLSGTTAVAPAGNMINTYYNMTTPWTIYDFANRTLNPQDFYDPVLYGSRTLSATSAFPRTRLPFPLLKRQDGGGIDEIEIDSDEDIQDLIDQGYIVEEID